MKTHKNHKSEFLTIRVSVTVMLIKSFSHMGCLTYYTGKMTFRPALTHKQLNQVKRCGVRHRHPKADYSVHHWPHHDWHMTKDGFTSAGESCSYYEEYAKESIYVIYEWCQKNNIELQGGFLWQSEYAKHAEGKIEATPDGIKCYEVKEVRYVFDEPTVFQLNSNKIKMDQVKSLVELNPHYKDDIFYDTDEDSDPDNEMSAVKYVNKKKRKIDEGDSAIKYFKKFQKH